MIRKFIICILLSTTLFTLFSCSANTEKNNPALTEIPEQSINYTNFTLGNVIQDGKQAIFLCFVSDYTVSSIEVSGALLDKDQKVIYSFEHSSSFRSPSYNPELAIRVESGLIKYVNSVTFTEIKAYTTEKVDADKKPVLRRIETANETTISNFFASGSTITVANGEINIQITGSDCGFRWDLSDVDLKPNTKYMIVFENINVEEINKKSIQLGTEWVDSSCSWPRYYHVDRKCFDIIYDGEISSEYYQFLTAKTYDEYTMEFSFSHPVDDVKNKTIYLVFWGAKKQLTINNLSIYEIINQ